jgi:predicted aconitase
MLAEPGARGLAMRVVVAAARALGAERLVAVASAHIDGCLYHGDSAVLFAERLVELGGRVEIPTSLNVGALDLIHPELVRADAHRREMGLRMAKAYEALGCAASWTCAPYQAGWRPKAGEHVAWGESNAVAFANSVLGARTERYGDFLDICAALTACAPYTGLHRPENRVARVVVDTSLLSERLKRTDAFYPVLGAWLGEAVGGGVAAILGLPPDVSEDRLKALGAAAASTGAVGLFHVVGVTPEAPTLDAVLAEGAAELRPTPAQIRERRDGLSSAAAEGVDAIAVGSPHFSAAEFVALERLLVGRRMKLPFYACTGRDTLAALEQSGAAARLDACGVTFIVDTCVVVTQILPAGGGVLMTNSAKFAHYALPNVGWRVAFGALADCVETAVAGRLRRDDAAWR